MKKMEEEYWQQDCLMDEAIISMIIHLGDSSDYMSTDEEGFWSSSEDEKWGKFFIPSNSLFCLIFK
jgi:hypothetical protein